MACNRLGARLPAFFSAASSSSASSSSSSAASSSSGLLRASPRLAAAAVPSSSSSSSSSSRRSFATGRPTLARKDAASPKAKAPVADAAPEPEILLGEVYTNRLADYYRNSLADDLLYLSYSHKLAIDPELPSANLSWLERDPTHSHAANRPHPGPPGSRGSLVPVRKSVDERSVPQLKSIVVSTFVREAIARKSQLLPAIHALRTITGQVKNGGNDRTKAGVEITRGRKGAATWNLRSGMPVGAKITLKGPEMYRFIETLTEFVFPRIRDWPGIKLPPRGARPEPRSGDETGGNVSFGFPPATMALFPQIEAALAIYTRLPGFNINFITNQRGANAKWRARALLSGFRFPFYTPEKERRRARYTGKVKRRR